MPFNPHLPLSTASPSLHGVSLLLLSPSKSSLSRRRTSHDSIQSSPPIPPAGGDLLSTSPADGLQIQPSSYELRPNPYPAAMAMAPPLGFLTQPSLVVARAGGRSPSLQWP